MCRKLRFKEIPAGYKFVDLFEYESSNQMASELGITTITFLKTNNQKKAISEIKSRLFQILKANPWLVGRLIRIKGQKGLKLIYLPDITEKDLNEVFHENEDIDISIKTPYSKLYKKIIKNKVARIPMGFHLINKDRPSLSLTISSIDDNNFALIYSLGHIISDGETYYRIFNMLSSNNPIKALNPKRKSLYSWKSAISEVDYKFLYRKSFIINVIRSYLFDRNTKLVAYYINEKEIDKAKKISQQNSDVPYISTNDIITSSFFKAISAKIGMMAINFRNKINGLNDNDAGNYEGVKLYDSGIYDTPEGIRKSLQGTIPYKSRIKPIPGTLETCYMNIGIITNWTSFTGKLKIDHCEEVLLHLPILPTHQPLNAAIIFYPQPNKIAMLISSQYFKPQYIKKAKGNNPLLKFLEKPISKEIFD